MDPKQKYIQKLEEIARLSSDEAKKLLIEEVKNDAKSDIAKIIREAEEEAKLTAKKKSQEILADAMMHGSLDYIAEYTVSVIKIQEEDVKGRIIGKEGRNIRAFETATGVDVGLDEEGIIRLSSFDSIRREVAKRTLEKLIKDTRIQPFRIEEVVKQTQKEVADILVEEGEKIAQEVGIFNLHPDLISMLGRFKFRSSFGQNLISHSLEVAKIGVHLAQEIGANEEIVKLGCLFHDIGKVVSDKEGSHVQLGVDFLQKYKLPKEVINCVAEHHEDKPFSSVESVLVYIADSASGGRPGARHEDVEEYAKRIRDMEGIAKSFEGVQDAYAFEAGREIRVIIDSKKLDDIETTITAKKIKEEIDKKLIVPGVVRVTAIREFRTSEPKE
ncbi:MAG: ribonuclease Y [Candidatus Levybacteria bacterium CG10_big_fil_rev_8_21_14_0_10_36_7]|nr:MAG: ribonuclease Y [Candidatus Levybacteria bacterium CG10_big_fil_rev_8_21_14_0_10_36_7]